jgi:hypothetical protein
VYYHGGVPHMQKYRPQLAYFTSHLGSARGYAARYVNRRRRRVPGDVYVVDLKGRAVEPDPDFHGPETTGVYVASSEIVTISAVVERGVSLARPRQDNRCMPEPTHRNVSRSQRSPRSMITGRL